MRPALYVTLRFRWNRLPQLRIGIYIPILRISLGAHPHRKDTRR